MIHDQNTNVRSSIFNKPTSGMWEKGIRTPFWLIRNGQLTSLSGKGDEMFRSILENGEGELRNNE